MMTNCFVCKKDVVGPNYYLHLQLEHSRPRVSHLIRVEANAIAEGKRQEQARIIKLLEAQCERPLDPKWEHYRESCSCWQIALIKGEK